MSGIRRFILPILAALSVGASGCETIPDHCEGYKLACVNVTVDSGPPNVQRLRVNVVQGIDTSTVLTPKKPPATPLAYPLRFAIRFGEFPDVFNGMISFDTIAMNDEFDIVGQTTTLIQIHFDEKTAVHISLGDPSIPPDMSSPAPDLYGLDLATPDLLTPDLSTPQSPDLTSSPDMP